MSDTTTITPEERAQWLSEAQPKNIDYYEPIDFELDKRIRNLIGALEQAEARAERAESAQLHLCQWLSDIAIELGCDCSNEAMLRAAHEIKSRAEKSEANVARLTKMVQILSEWCAQFESGHTLEEIGLALTNGMACPEPWQYSEEAARRAVAAGEE